MDLFFRPLDNATWISEKGKRYKSCPFRAGFERTLSQLRYELEHLKAQRAAIEIDYDGAELRIDGLPYANARPKSPRVRLSFEAPGIGPQAYMSETYGTWQENLRGIVMTLDRLRAVERYGATRGKQQYRGWAGLPAKAWDGFKDRAEAVAFLKRAAELNGEWNGDVDGLYRAAAARHHPDKGGTDDMMAKINQARKVAVQP